MVHSTYKYGILRVQKWYIPCTKMVYSLYKYSALHNKNMVHMVHLEQSTLKTRATPNHAIPSHTPPLKTPSQACL